MRHSLRLLSLILVLFACGLPMRADEKKAEKPDPKEKAVKQQLDSGRAITGKLVRVEGAQKYVTLQISIPYLRPTIAGYNTFRGRAIPRYGVSLHQFTKDVELQATDDMKVRTMQLPQDFDEKGKPKKYTSQELKDLRGPDSTLPGYNADFDSLKQDQVVRVYLAKRKADPKPAAAPAEKPKAKEKDKEAEKVAEDRPEVAMIVILVEPKK